MDYQVSLTQACEAVFALYGKQAGNYLVKKAMNQIISAGTGGIPSEILTMVAMACAGTGEESPEQKLKEQVLEQLELDDKAVKRAQMLADEAKSTAKTRKKTAMFGMQTMMLDDFKTADVTGTQDFINTIRKDLEQVKSSVKKTGQIVEKVEDGVTGVENVTGLSLGGDEVAELSKFLDSFNEELSTVTRGMRKLEQTMNTVRELHGTWTSYLNLKETYTKDPCGLWLDRYQEASGWIDLKIGSGWTKEGFDALKAHIQVMKQTSSEHVNTIRKPSDALQKHLSKPESETNPVPQETKTDTVTCLFGITKLAKLIFDR